MNKTIIYHANCTDGFCSAWLCHLVWPDAEFIPANYGWNPPNVTGKDVLIVDFSYPREVLLNLKAQASSLVVLDHHKTAENALAGLDFCHFDMTKSGAGLTWDYLTNLKLLCPNTVWPIWKNLYGFWAQPKKWFETKPSTNFPNALPRHWLVAYVEDYDIQNEALPLHNEMCAVIRSTPETFQDFTKLSKQPPYSLVEKGKAIIDYQNLIIQSHVKHAVEVEINGATGIGVSCSLNKLWTGVGKGLLTTYPEYKFAVIWQDTSDGTRLYSLRSNKTGFNVREIAESMGGGGHNGSAGFKVECTTCLKGPVIHRKRQESKSK